MLLHLTSKAELYIFHRDFPLTQLSTTNMEIEIKAEPPPTKSLGTLRLQTTDTNEIIRIPVPTDDPNDPLNW